jgi:hypothetical protein
MKSKLKNTPRRSSRFPIGNSVGRTSFWKQQKIVIGVMQKSSTGQQLRFADQNIYEVLDCQLKFTTQSLELLNKIHSSPYWWIRKLIKSPEINRKDLTMLVWKQSEFSGDKWRYRVRSLPKKGKEGKILPSFKVLLYQVKSLAGWLQFHVTKHEKSNSIPLHSLFQVQIKSKIRCREEKFTSTNKNGMDALGSNFNSEN